MTPINTLPTLSFDLDGVFANFTRAFVRTVNECFGTEYGEDWPTFMPQECGFFKPEHFLAGFDLIREIPFFWATLEPYERVPFLRIESLMVDGAMTGYFVSSRRDTLAEGGDARLMSRIWLENQGITSAQGVMVSPHNSTQRAEILKTLGVDAHLDDCGEQVTVLRDAGVNAYLLDRSWNQHIPIDHQFRVYSIDEFLVKALAGRIPNDFSSFFSPAAQADVTRHPGNLSPETTVEFYRTSPFPFSARQRVPDARLA